MPDQPFAWLFLIGEDKESQTTQMNTMRGNYEKVPVSIPVLNSICNCQGTGSL